MRFVPFMPAITALLVICPQTAVSETLDQESDSTRWLDDVTVTAIKQNSDMSLQPVAVTTVVRKSAEMWDVNAVKSVSEIAPNFYVPVYGSRMTSSIYMRGIGSRMDQPAVGLSVDNLTFLSKDSYDFDVDDIERVEVLRGPQSTLYGRNTMSGQINIYTIQPMDYQGSRVMATVGNGPTARMSLSHYRKFTGNLAMGFTGSFNLSNGFFKNHYNAFDCGTEKSGNLRWKTQWRASESVSLDNVASFSMYRQGGYPYMLEGSGEINYNDTCYYRRNSVADGLTVKWTTPGFTLSSITGLQYVDDCMTLDQDFLPVKYFTLSQSRHEWSLTQDVVARGAAGAYSWLGGVFGFYKRSNMGAPVDLKEDGIERFITGTVNQNPKIPVQLEFADHDILLRSGFHIPVWGVAAYHQSAYDFGRWNVALGLRLDYESTRLDYRSMCNTSVSAFMKSGLPPMAVMTVPVDLDLHGKLKNHFLEFIPKLTISYELPMRSGSSLYASVGKGYKSGGFNTQIFSEILQQAMKAQVMAGMPGMGGGAPEIPTVEDVDRTVSYKPERSWNYEVGAHVGCADGRVMTDLAIFYIDCRDQQITTFPDESTTGRITTNAGHTRSFGAEVQINYRPTAQWQINASYGYTNAKFMRYRDGKDNYKGRFVPYAPTNTVFVSGAYTHNAGAAWSLTYNLRCRGVGHIYWNEANDARQPFYALLGASVTARTSWISLEAWMENITATDYNVFRFTSLNNSFVQQGNPRTFGLTVRLEFGN